MADLDFIVVGSGGGGGTIAWMLARAGYKTLLLEQGADWTRPIHESDRSFDPTMHDEFRFRLERPDPKRRLRGDYCTFRPSEKVDARPFSGGYTGTALGGGSMLWGGWAVRPLPVDLRLRDHFQRTGQLEELERWGYSIPDWPVSYSEFEPYFNIAEVLLAVCGDRDAMNRALVESEWYKALSSINPNFAEYGAWAADFPYPAPDYPLTPVGRFVHQGARHAGLNPVCLPTALVHPGGPEYDTREQIARAQASWRDRSGSFWRRPAEELWSERRRDPCNLCGYCGEYVCWGSRPPKSGTFSTTIRELNDLPEFAEVRTGAKVIEVMYDDRLRRATGVKYLDLTDPDNPVIRIERARFVILSCGAVQTSRLLLLSGPPEGLGNRYGNIGRYAMFHLFGMTARCVLPEKYQGMLHSQIGNTGSAAIYDHYFLKDEDERWWKSGILTGTQRKDPLFHAYELVSGTGAKIGLDLLREMDRYARSLELRATGDDLPMADNRVTLDPTYVDEFGLPVARITRRFGEHERLIFRLLRSRLEDIFSRYQDLGIELRVPDSADLTLIGDHQMGTCRMGDDPLTSVVDRNCRMHEVRNVFIVDSSFMPTGLGVNPMVSVMANALRVGTWIVDNLAKGRELD